MADVEVRRDRAYYKSPEYKRECRARKAEREGRVFRPGVPGRAPRHRLACPAQEARAAWREWIEVRAPRWWLKRYACVRKQLQAAKDKAKFRRAYEADPEGQRQRVRGYKDRNPDRVGQWHATRQSRMTQGGVEPLSNRVMSAIFERKRCPYCGTPLNDDVELDHVIPLARGGRHEARNLIACCGGCNRRKAARPFSEWLTMLPDRQRVAARRMFVRRFGDVDAAEQVALTS